MYGIVMGGPTHGYSESPQVEAKSQKDRRTGGSPKLTYSRRMDQDHKLERACAVA